MTNFFRFIINLLQTNDAKFILGIIFSWYTVIVGSALTTLYYVLQGMTSSGVLDRIRIFIFKIFANIQHIAHDCSSVIGVENIKVLFDCINQANGF